MEGELVVVVESGQVMRRKLHSLARSGAKLIAHVHVSASPVATLPTRLSYFDKNKDFETRGLGCLLCYTRHRTFHSSSSLSPPSSPPISSSVPDWLLLLFFSFNNATCSF